MRTAARRRKRVGGPARSKTLVTKGKTPRKRPLAQPPETRGYGVRVEVVDSTSGTVYQKDAKLEWGLAEKSKRGGGKVSSRGARRPRLSSRTLEALAAVGHPVRARLLTKLLEAPATYQALKRLTRLAPGPLYFHIGQLRGCGLIMPKQRDLYELTRGGRNLILTTLAIGPLVHDRRRCPMA